MILVGELFFRDSPLINQPTILLNFWLRLGENNNRLGLFLSLNYELQCHTHRQFTQRAMCKLQENIRKERGKDI